MLTRMKLTPPSLPNHLKAADEQGQIINLARQSESEMNIAPGICVVLSSTLISMTQTSIDVLKSNQISHPSAIVL